MQRGVEAELLAKAGELLNAKETHAVQIQELKQQLSKSGDDLVEMRTKYADAQFKFEATETKYADAQRKFEAMEEEKNKAANWLERSKSENANQMRQISELKGQLTKMSEQKVVIYLFF